VREEYGTYIPDHSTGTARDMGKVKWIVNIMIEIDNEEIARNFARGAELGYVHVPEDYETIEVTIDKVDLDE
jgi:hypothetical protein